MILALAALLAIAAATASALVADALIEHLIHHEEPDP